MDGSGIRNALERWGAILAETPDAKATIATRPDELIQDGAALRLAEIPAAAKGVRASEGEIRKWLCPLAGIGVRVGAYPRAHQVRLHFTLAPAHYRRQT